MFNFFLPSKTKKVLEEAKLILSNLTRNRVLEQDVLNERDLAALKALEDRYPALIQAKDADALDKLNKESLRLGNKLFPPSPWDGWRENIEVFVVAAIMALGIRTFFLQPFKIPTGSMEPTLLGIEPKPTADLPPSLPFQVYDFLIHGRTYSRVTTKQGGRIVSFKPGTMTIWFEYTDLTLEDAQGHDEVDRIWIRAQDVESKLGIFPYDDPRGGSKTYAPGDVLANYATQTGDQVLVDKITYNFRGPDRGDVIIFKTAGIPGLEHELGPDQEGSEDFIKRCVGFAGDMIEVKPPYVYVNGNPAAGATAFAHEFTQTPAYPGGPPYPGYTLVPWDDPRPGDACTGVTKDMNRPFDPYDKDNTQTYYVPANCYWAMGDNSPYSKDSRYWGGVPNQNLVGRGYFVFWPFTSRWGFIR
ncbi:MAG TPA: signal peptidase I [Candidatus Methylacidiphilales bacterium]|nr:signal peptidase I [Candidatus Methylacidiphilales bacterium]